MENQMAVEVAIKGFGTALKAALTNTNPSNVLPLMNVQITLDRLAFLFGEQAQNIDTLRQEVELLKRRP